MQSLKIFHYISLIGHGTAFCVYIQAQVFLPILAVTQEAQVFLPILAVTQTHMNIIPLSFKHTLKSYIHFTSSRVYL
jgi:hypothetical protein